MALVAPFDLGDRDLVVVPTGPLAMVPWGLLPGLRGRSVTVTPSASVWLRGRCVEPLTDNAGPLIVAGPDLSHTTAEAEQVARLFPRSTVLTGSAASVSATLTAWHGRHTCGSSASSSANRPGEPDNELTDAEWPRSPTGRVLTDKAVS
ncbi:CHAT domain-containing protein [Saccharothrix sp. NRRL B-16348]|uniref:CHAT domain-containing protein n=1 Tax=Saccharothrix sp. NRRL B-16348 TaxID=1415542 RepID=UPI0012F8282C|nr:hypothetical protein [Saccharothrix sp. NRRL B-16348]